MTPSKTHGTDERGLRSGVYRFVAYMGDGDSPAPTEEEREIPLARGEVFPPVRSTARGARWQLVRDA